MPIKSMAPHFGVYSPSDLSFLQSIYDEATIGLSAVRVRVKLSPAALV